MGRYRGYPEYKESGVEWLERVPAHWSIVSLKLLVDVRDGTHDTPPYVEPNEQSFPLVTSKDVTSGKLIFDSCKHISKNDYLSIIQRSKVDIGDILMPMIGTVGSPIVVKDRNNFSIKNLALFKTANSTLVNASFLNYFIQSNECGVQFGLESRGGVQNFVSLSTLRDLGIPNAPFTEQIQIAAFLDHETAKIDALIEKQQTLIALLKEKRQAVISHAVTKGLNPDVPMKDSGVEWLGAVPEHWGNGRLRWYINISSGDGLSNSEFEMEQNETTKYRVIGGNGTLGYSTRVNTTQKAFAIGRVGALCGNVHFIDEECWITDNALKICSWRDYEPDYLYFLLIATRLNEHASRSAQPLITGEQVKSLNVPIPPANEQAKISDFIISELSRLSVLIDKCEEAIKLMQERRIAIISATVTGKIDVRNWQAPAHDQPNSVDAA